MKFLHLIWGNLMRRKLRTTLTLLSIIVAFILFGFLCTIKNALSGGVQMAGANRLIVRQKVSIINLLPETYKQRMERIPGVTLATHQTWFGGIYQDKKNFFMQNPVIPEEFLRVHSELILPPEQLKAWQETRTGAIVGRKTAERYHWKIGDKIPIQSAIWGKGDGNRTWTFDIVGIYDGNGKNTDLTPLFFRYDYFDEERRTSWGKGQVGWYTILIKDSTKSAEIAEAVDKEFENSPAETKTEPEGAFAQSWANQVGNIAVITYSITGAVFFTILLVAGNTMSQAVRERTGELAVLKAIGFTDADVVMIVLAESCLLSIIGGLIGLGFAVLLTAGGDPTGGRLPLFYFPNVALIVGIVLSLVLGIVTGILPAMQAMKLRVADALRRA